jgi:Domain of unknown function (DUF4326)
MPDRIQLSRKRGWRLGPNAKSVARPSLWGNPFAVDAYVIDDDRDPPVPWPGPPPSEPVPGLRVVRDRADAVALFIRWVPYVRDEESGLTYAEFARRDLAGLSLGCWCPPGEPCHADALLALAAGRRMTTPDVTLPEGGERIHVKRCCNGCGDPIGDVTDDEINRAIDGRPLPDVRKECPRCAEPAEEDNDA